ncbi:hypothetical protein F4808DRAFT_381648 [Astrocystis sublimbata]|nr:hypothetical protein F4808DRAFT_381648 [Astrocystis sublimbata]
MFYETVDGRTIGRVDEALKTLANDPQKLARARSRFSCSPSRYLSVTGSTTQPPSIQTQSAIRQHWLESKRYELKQQWFQTMPSTMLRIQIETEKSRLIEASKNGIHLVPFGIPISEFARQSIRRSWVAQGIWNENWGNDGRWRWNHERPLEVKPEVQAVLDRAQCKRDNPKRPANGRNYIRLPDSDVEDDEDTWQIKQTHAQRVREHEASRPFQQFSYQVSIECERIQQRLERKGKPSSDPADINSRAYETVKATWEEWKIWDRNWGVLPGRSWRHERGSRDEWVEEEMKFVTYVESPSPPERSPLNFGEIGLEPFRSIEPTPPGEQNKLATPRPTQWSTVPISQWIEDLPMGDASPDYYPTITPEASSRPETPPRPPNLGKGASQHPQKAEAPRLEPTTQDPLLQHSPTSSSPARTSPAPLRRSKRIQEAKNAAARDNITILNTPANRRGRTKRGGSKADTQAQAVSAKDARVSKRQATKHKKTGR